MVPTYYVHTSTSYFRSILLFKREYKDMFDKNNNKWIIYWVVNLGFCKFLLLLLSSTLTIFSVYFSTFPLGLNNTKVFALVIMVKV